MSPVSIPAHLREQLDWLDAYFLLVKHDGSQAREKAVGEAKAASAESNGSEGPTAIEALNHKRPTCDFDNSITPYFQEVMAASATAQSGDSIENDGPVAFDDFKLQHEANLVPVPLGKPRGGQPLYIPRLYQLAQSRGISPVFEYDENSPQHFSVKLTLEDLVVEDAGPFKSKKEAKESVAEKGFFALKLHPEVKISPHSVDKTNASLPEASQEPWVSILNG